MHVMKSNTRLLSHKVEKSAVSYDIFMLASHTTIEQTQSVQSSS